MRVRVTFNGVVIADSADVIKLEEADYEPVFYLPAQRRERWIGSAGPRIERITPLRCRGARVPYDRANSQTNVASCRDEKRKKLSR